MKQLNLLKTLFLLCALVVGSLNSVWAQDDILDFSTLGLENAVQYSDPFDGGDFTVTFAGGGNDGKYYTTGTGIRVYGNGTMTVASATKTIGKIEIVFSGDSYKPTSADVVDNGSYDYTTGTWTGNSKKIVFTRPSGSGHWRVQVIKVTYVSEDTRTAVATIGDLTSTTLEYGAEGTFTPVITPATGLTASDYTVAWDEVDNAQLTLLEDGTYEAGTTTGSVEVKVTVTPSAAKAEEYKAVSKTFNITVINPNANDGSLAKPFTVAEVNDGTASGSSVYVKGIIVGVFEGKDADAETTAPFEKTNFALSDSRNEISGSKTIAVQLPSGPIRNAWNLEENNVLGMEVLVKGNIESYFSGKTGVKSPAEIIAVSVPATITCEGGVASFASTYALDLTNLPEGVEAYKATEAGSNKVSLEKVEVAVPEGTGLILKGTKDEIYAIPVAESASALADNLLVGVTDPAGADITANSAYGLSKTDGKFHKIGADITIPAGKAYLPASSLSANELELDFGESGDVTGINEIAAGKAFNGEFFNLAGQRVAQPTKGLYIVNGKKIVIK